MLLTRQGAAASGGKNELFGGWQLDRWIRACGLSWRVGIRSGVMTFIVNQEGKVYQQDLGEKTSRIAGTMKSYNPDSAWTLVGDDGEPNAVSEK